MSPVGKVDNAVAAKSSASLQKTVNAIWFEFHKANGIDQIDKAAEKFIALAGKGQAQAKKVADEIAWYLLKEYKAPKLGPDDQPCDYKAKVLMNNLIKLYDGANTKYFKGNETLAKKIRSGIVSLFIHIDKEDKGQYHLYEKCHAYNQLIDWKIGDYKNAPHDAP